MSFTGHSSKGISPLIAAVMLIAFTIAVGSIFAQWSSGMFTSAQEDTSDKANRVQSCSQANLQFLEEPTEQKVIVLQKSGPVSVGKVGATWYYPDDVYQNSSFINNTGSFTVIENPKDSFSGNLDKITVAALNCTGATSITYFSEDN